MDRYLTELIGTFFLVLAVGFAAVSGSSFGPLAIGSTFMVMVYMGGHVSGGHYNPAVSLGVFLRGKMDKADVIPYMAAQLIGSMLAAIVVIAMTDTAFAPAPGPGVGIGAMFIAELLYTFALVLVVLNTATHPDVEGNSFYGLAIGFTVAIGVWTVGPISGGAFNPAVGTGPILVSAFMGGSLANLWLYLTAPFLGGLLAVPVFRLQLGR
jgi:aquaporin Z